MVRKTFLSILLAAFSLTAAAQTAEQEIAARRALSGANYLAYPAPTKAVTPAPEGFAPVYLTQYARHGSRWQINPKGYEEPRALLRREHEKGNLTAVGERAFSVVDSVARMAYKRYGELTPLGARQHHEIARRTFERYPDVFRKGAAIDARSTVVIRCILSMMAECLEYQTLAPHLTFRADASEHDMHYMNHNTDSVLRALRRAPKVRKAQAEVHDRLIHPDRLTGVLFKDTTVVSGLPKYVLFKDLYNIARNMQSLDTDLELFSLFTDRELYELWAEDNWSWYVNYAYSPLTDYRMPHTQLPLLKDFITKADSCLRLPVPGATLRFGHEVVVLPLAVLMELGNTGYRTSDPLTLDEHWRNYRIFPMGSNIQWVFYRNDKGETLVKALLNEEEVTLPVQSRTAPYYRWEDVRSYYLRKITEAERTEKEHRK